MFKELVRGELDKALGFAMRHTDDSGLYRVDDEVDRKDPGWLVLGGVIRGLASGWALDGLDLGEYCRRWTLAAIRTDDRRSAWTTFALLYTLFLDGGGQGAFFQRLTPAERGEFAAFIRQLDFHYLREASRNYQVAAGFIAELATRFGFIDRAELPAPPDASVQVMLDGYLGDGFFNDDDGRNPGADRRIDGYSAEIVGLLLHYDEIFGFDSFCHAQLRRIVADFCGAQLALNDADGEYAKWGRSLRGEAEIKKAMLWEYAEREGLLATPGTGMAVAEKLLAFYRNHGRSEDGRVYKDKGRNLGVWDEYTTHVQAQGYGVYGLAMALRFAPDPAPRPVPLPAETGDYVRFLSAPGIVVGNRRGAFHYVAPLGNRFTRPMFFWHNRLTGENDVYADVSHKFMPIPYFGRRLPAPYSGPEVPFVPMLLDASGAPLTPRNFNPDFSVEEIGDAIAAVQHFGYSAVGGYQELPGPKLEMHAAFRSDGFTYRFALGSMPETWRIRLFIPLGDAAATALPDASFRFDWPDRSLVLTTDLPGARAETVDGGRSIYGGPARLLRLTANPVRAFSFGLTFSAKG